MPMEIEIDNPLSEWPELNANCSRCPGCFTNQYGRVRACIPPDAPRPGNGPLRPPLLAERPAAPDPYEATKEAIRAAYIAGQTLTEISRDLTARGIPTRHAKSWCPATVRSIVLQMPRSERIKRDA
jgi:hypothetical protein